MPYSYDFQALHRRLQDSSTRSESRTVPEPRPNSIRSRENSTGSTASLSRIEGEFAPSVLRKFFDHIKRQDEKVLCALIKFYLLYRHFEQDTLDKLDILCTRLAEAPSEDGLADTEGPGRTATGHF